MKKIKEKITNMKNDKKIYKNYINALYSIPKVKEDFRKNEEFQEIKKYVEKHNK